MSFKRPCASVNVDHAARRKFCNLGRPQKTACAIPQQPLQMGYGAPRRHARRSLMSDGMGFEARHVASIGVEFLQDDFMGCG